MPSPEKPTGTSYLSTAAKVSGTAVACVFQLVSNSGSNIFNVENARALLPYPYNGTNPNAAVNCNATLNFTDAPTNINTTTPITTDHSSEAFDTFVFYFTIYLLISTNILMLGARIPSIIFKTFPNKKPVRVPIEELNPDDELETTEPLTEAANDLLFDETDDAITLSELENATRRKPAVIFKESAITIAAETTTHRSAISRALSYVYDNKMFSLLKFFSLSSCTFVGLNAFLGGASFWEKSWALIKETACTNRTAATILILLGLSSLVGFSKFYYNLSYNQRDADINSRKFTDIILNIPTYIKDGTLANQFKDPQIRSAIIKTAGISTLALASTIPVGYFTTLSAQVKFCTLLGFAATEIAVALMTIFAIISAYSGFTNLVATLLTSVPSVFNLVSTKANNMGWDPEDRFSFEKPFLLFMKLATVGDFINTFLGYVVGLIVVLSQMFNAEKNSLAIIIPGVLIAFCSTVINTIYNALAASENTINQLHVRAGHVKIPILDSKSLADNGGVYTSLPTDENISDDDPHLPRTENIGDEFLIFPDPDQLDRESISRLKNQSFATLNHLTMFGKAHRRRTMSSSASHGLNESQDDTLSPPAETFGLQY